MVEAGQRKHVALHIEGIVQGVGYRWWCCAAAESLDLKGFVRNEDDGSVYIEVEGQSDAIDAFSALCRRGPRAAIVRSASIGEGAWRDYKIFEVRHG